MKKTILFLLTSLVLFIAADAQECCEKEICCVDRMNFYAKIMSGANFLQSATSNGNNSAYHTGYMISGSLGFCWRPYGLCPEFEYGYRRNGIKTIHFITQGSSNQGNFQTSSYMANLLWDLPLCSWGWRFWNIQPFIGAGIGYDFQQLHSSNSRIVFYQKWHNFSGQVMAGFAYPIFRNTEISLEYKFHQGGRHFLNHSLGLGLTYKFGYLK